MGGYTPRKIAGAQVVWLRWRDCERAFTVRGLVRELASERALKVDGRSEWSFLHTERPYKKWRCSAVRDITATSPGGGHAALIVNRLARRRASR